MTRLILIVCAAMATMLCMAAASEAHKVNIFAYVDGDSVVTDSGYSRSKRVYDGVVEVYDAASGDLLLSGETDQKGIFTFVIPDRAKEERLDLRLLLKAGEGHQAEWTVKAEEFSAAAEAAVAVPEAQPEVQPEAQPEAAVMEQLDSASAKRVEEIVRRELAPVKRMLSEMNDPGPTVADIVGGIGWIIGLFGVAAYMKSRKNSA